MLKDKQVNFGNVSRLAHKCHLPTHFVKHSGHHHPRVHPGQLHLRSLESIPANFIWEAWKIGKKQEKRKTTTKRLEAWQMWTCSCNYMWLLLLACTRTQDWCWQRYEERLDDVAVSKKKHDAATAWVWLSSGLGFDATVHLHVVSLSLPPVIGVFQPPCRTLPDGAHWHWYQSGPQKRAWLHDVSLLDLCDYKACISMLASINGTIVNLLDQTSVVSDQIVIKEHGGGSNRIG